MFTLREGGYSHRPFGIHRWRMGFCPVLTHSHLFISLLKKYERLYSEAGAPAPAPPAGPLPHSHQPLGVGGAQGWDLLTAAGGLQLPVTSWLWAYSTRGMAFTFPTLRPRLSPLVSGQSHHLYSAAQASACVRITPRACSNPNPGRRTLPPKEARVWPECAFWAGFQVMLTRLVWETTFWQPLWGT